MIIFKERKYFGSPVNLLKEVEYHCQQVINKIAITTGGLGYIEKPKPYW